MVSFSQCVFAQQKGELYGWLIDYKDHHSSKSLFNYVKEKMNTTGMPKFGTHQRGKAIKAMYTVLDGHNRRITDHIIKDMSKKISEQYEGTFAKLYDERTFSETDVLYIMIFNTTRTTVSINYKQDMEQYALKNRSKFLFFNFFTPKDVRIVVLHFTSPDNKDVPNYKDFRIETDKTINAEVIGIRMLPRPPYNTLHESNDDAYKKIAEISGLVKK